MIKTKEDVLSLVKDIPDFPKPGIIFKDLTPILLSSEALGWVIREKVLNTVQWKPTKILGVESRGYWSAVPIALQMKLPFVPLRKPGKLPRETVSKAYGLEYGKDELHVHKEDVQPGDRVLLVDDLLATGGTLKAAVGLMRELGAEVVGAAVIMELTFLKGRDLLDCPIYSVLEV